MPTTPIGYLFLFLAALVAGAGWTVGSAIASTIIGWMRRDEK